MRFLHSPTDSGKLSTPFYTSPSPGTSTMKPSTFIFYDQLVYGRDMYKYRFFFKKNSKKSLINKIKLVKSKKKTREVTCHNLRGDTCQLESPKPNFL